MLFNTRSINDGVKVLLFVESYISQCYLYKYFIPKERCCRLDIMAQSIFIFQSDTHPTISCQGTIRRFRAAAGPVIDFVPRRGRERGFRFCMINAANPSSSVKSPPSRAHTVSETHNCDDWTYEHDPRMCHNFANSKYGLAFEGFVEHGLHNFGHVYLIWRDE